MHTLKYNLPYSPFFYYCQDGNWSNTVNRLSLSGFAYRETTKDSDGTFSHMFVNHNTRKVVFVQYA